MAGGRCTNFPGDASCVDPTNQGVFWASNGSKLTAYRFPHRFGGTIEEHETEHSANGPGIGENRVRDSIRDATPQAIWRPPPHHAAKVLKSFNRADHFPVLPIEKSTVEGPSRPGWEAADHRLTSVHDTYGNCVRYRRGHPGCVDGDVVRANNRQKVGLDQASDVTGLWSGNALFDRRSIP